MIIKEMLIKAKKYSLAQAHFTTARNKLNSAMNSGASALSEDERNEIQKAVLTCDIMITKFGLNKLESVLKDKGIDPLQNIEPKK